MTNNLLLAQITFQVVKKTTFCLKKLRERKIMITSDNLVNLIKQQFGRWHLSGFGLPLGAGKTVSPMMRPNICAQEEGVATD